MEKDRTHVTSDTEVKTTELAGILGVSARRIQQLAQDDIFRPVRRGWFSLGDSVRRYIAFLDKEKKQESDAEREQSRKRVRADVEWKEARAKMAKLQAEELEGTMHRAEDVQAMTEQLLYAVRGALSALPGRCGKEVAETDNVRETIAILQREVNAAMDELQNFRYDPDAYKRLVHDRQNWEQDHGEETD